MVRARDGADSAARSSVVAFDSLLMDFAEREGAAIIVRGPARRRRFRI